MATTEEIKKAAILVRDATQIGENTAERVGGVLVDLANKSKELEDNIETKADSTETKNKFDAIDKKNKEQDTAIDMKFDSSNVSQELGSSEKKVPSQKLVTEKFKEETARVNAELGKKANAEEVNNSMQELAKKLNRNLLAIEFDDETGDLNAIIGQDTTIKSVETDEDGNVIIEQEIS